MQRPFIRLGTETDYRRCSSFSVYKQLPLGSSQKTFKITITLNVNGALHEKPTYGYADEGGRSLKSFTGRLAAGTK